MANERFPNLTSRMLRTVDTGVLEWIEPVFPYNYIFDIDVEEFYRHAELPDQDPDTSMVSVRAQLRRIGTTEARIELLSANLAAVAKGFHIDYEELWGAFPTCYPRPMDGLFRIENFWGRW